MNVVIIQFTPSSTKTDTKIISFDVHGFNTFSKIFFKQCHNINKSFVQVQTVGMSLNVLSNIPEMLF